ncbi:MAG: hypothetical protein US74_C0044G0018 [Parcubacteria group bacterium GW2011_GWA2_38_13]|nr:MAG: hypothetical protein US74_C0044G0018 [Parcubacteria group bacterium GW2011_GWA2_38_13]
MRYYKSALLAVSFVSCGLFKILFTNKKNDEWYNQKGGD